MKSKLKVRAIKLRKQGATYSEILREIPVAKSTLSLWFRSVNLSKRQKHRLTKRKLAAARRGGLARRRQRLEITKQIKKIARLEIKKINNETLHLIGSVLYWGEGSKSKEHSPSQGVIFSNSDPQMIKVFLKWLKTCLEISDERICLNIAIHENYKGRNKAVLKYWTDITGFPIGKFGKIYYKKHRINSNRKNIGKDYQGLLRIRLKKSTNLNRKITGWIEGVCIQCGVVELVTRSPLERKIPGSSPGSAA